MIVKRAALDFRHLIGNEGEPKFVMLLQAEIERHNRPGV